MERNYARLRSRLIVLLLAAAALHAVAAPRAVAAASSKPDRPHVLVVGDSLTYGAEHRGSLSRRLSRVATPLVVGVNGLAAHRTPELLQQNLTTLPRTTLVVIAVGTNDAMYHLSNEAFRRRVVEIMDAVKGRSVLWVNLKTTAFAGHSKRLNRVLSSVDRQRSDLTVLNWANEPASRLLQSDGVHLTAKGYQRRAAFITRAVREELTPHR